MTTISRPRPPTDVDRSSSRSTSPGLAAALGLGASVAGLAAGIGTSYGQAVLPGQWNQIANSGAVWTLLAFAIAVPCARTHCLAVAGGALALVAEVAGYYALASPLRHIPTTHGELILWTVAALWVGPASGLAAWCVRRGAPQQRVGAVLALAGLMAGEGVYELHRLGQSTFGRAEIWTAAFTGLTAFVCSGARWGARLLAVLLALVIAVSTYAVYAQTILM